jgi:hypothetical protein
VRFESAAGNSNLEHPRSVEASIPEGPAAPATSTVGSTRGAAAEDPAESTERLRLPPSALVAPSPHCRPSTPKSHAAWPR